MNPRITLEVDLDGLAYNVRTIRDRIAPCALTAVLKANAYGMGVRRIAPVVRDNGADMFGAATVGIAGRERERCGFDEVKCDRLRKAGAHVLCDCFENAAEIFAFLEGEA